MVSDKFNRELFIDENIFVAANICINKINTNEQYKTSTKKTKIKNIKYMIFKYFKDLMLKDLTKNKLINIYNTLDNRKDVSIMNYFLITLCENNLLDTDICKRVCYFKDRLLTYSIKKDIPILFLNNFDDFLATVPNNTNIKNISQLFFLQIEDKIKDKTLLHELNKLLSKYKLDTHYVIKSRINNCHLLKKFITQLENINLQLFNTNQLLNVLNNCKLKNTQAYIIIDFLYQLNEDSLIYDLDLNKKITALKNNNVNGIGIDKLIELLNNEYLYRIFYRKKDKSNKYYFIPHIHNDITYDIIKNYVLNTVYATKIFKTVITDFGIALNGYPIHSINDFNLTTLKLQINYFKDHCNDRRAFRFLCDIYLYILKEYNPNLLINDSISTNVLLHKNLGQYLYEGYDFISYNPIEDVPLEDKWILNYTNKNEGNLSITTNEFFAIDFTEIKNKTYRDWYKYYVWKDNASMYNKIHMKSNIKEFFNYISDLKEGKQLSIYSKPTKKISISQNEILAYKTYILNTKENYRTRARYIYSPRSVLKFLHNNNIQTFSEGVFHHLYFSVDNNYDNKKSIPKDELEKIANLMRKNAEKDNFATINYLVFYIALETEFRPSQIFSLEKDCIRETSKKNEYVLISKTKLSNGEYLEQSITEYTKKQLNEIKKLTNPYRADCKIQNLKDYLFLIPNRHKYGEYILLNNSSFNHYLKDCCEKLGLEAYTLENLRDTHMTKAEEFRIRNQLSDMDQKILSGHSNVNTDNKYYVDTPIKELLESVHGVIIGDVDVTGKIKDTLPSNIKTKENSVSNNCGYCFSKTCTDFSYLACLLCPSFVTTLDRLPYFEEQVKIIDEKILNTTIPHDKEDLINIKRLLLGFINAILEKKFMKGGSINE